MVNPCHMTWLLAPVALLTLGVSFSSAESAGQESRTGPLAQELTTLLSSQKRDAVAARLGGEEFVAALYFPGTQLLVIKAKYAAPALLFEKIVSKNYKDAYLDLATASLPDTKIMIEDMKSDGLHVERGNKNDPFDIVTSATQAVQFDGEYKKRKMSEEAYLKAFSEADAAYERMLTALVAELKK
jgi:GGDEF domain-containing protein